MIFCVFKAHEMTWSGLTRLTMADQTVHSESAKTATMHKELEVARAEEAAFLRKRLDFMRKELEAAREEAAAARKEETAARKEAAAALKEAQQREYALQQAMKTLTWQAHESQRDLTFEKTVNQLLKERLANSEQLVEVLKKCAARATVGE